jgi:hypothetical protein
VVTIRSFASKSEAESALDALIEDGKDAAAYRIRKEGYAVPPCAERIFSLLLTKLRPRSRNSAWRSCAAPAAKEGGEVLDPFPDVDGWIPP